MNKRDNEFIILRDKFYEEIEPKEKKAQINSWNFYTNSIPENMKELKKSQEEVFYLFQNKELYNKCKELEKSWLEDKRLAKQLNKF